MNDKGIASSSVSHDSSLRVDRLNCGYDGKPVVSNFSMSVYPGEIHCLLGPNGVGKTTLFKTMLSLLPGLGGKVIVDGRDVAALKPSELARYVAYVPQAHTPPFAFTARDVVVMGRLAHMGAFASPRTIDYDKAERAIDQLGITRLAQRTYTELSGGERQMVLIARALAQGAHYLMMDEPTASLDFGNQAQVLYRVRTLAEESGLGVIMTTHTPDHLFMLHASGTLLLRDGTFLQGTAKELLTREYLSQAYGVDVMVVDAQWQGHDECFCRPVLKGIGA